MLFVKKKLGKLNKYGFERGIIFFDSARAYGDSEEKIGVAYAR